jgi:hypothetical protein
MHRFSFVRKRVGVVAVAAASVLLVAGGVAYATIPDSNSVIHSCYATKGGGLRVIDTGAGESCNPKESPLDWNAQGPKGDQGPAGISGLDQYTHSASIPPGGWILNVDCPTGKLAISGGWNASGFDAFEVRSSIPYKDDSGWSFVFFNTTSSTITVTAYAMCANAQ